VSLVRRVAEQGITVIQSVYPNPTQGIAAETLSTRKRSWTWLARRAPEEITYSVPAIKRGAPDRVILHRGKSAIVLAVNWRGLIREAQRAGCVIEFAVQVGDFLSVDEPIFYIHGNAEAVNDQRLFDLVALGSERTMEQDPMFSFRIEVDIALKALSAAINDPTTAVLAIDQLHRLLRMVGKRSLRDQGITDHTGQPRVVLRTAAERIELREVPLSADGSCTTTFWIGVWHGDEDPFTHEVLENLRGPVDNHLVIYAADYDVQRGFHANTWPEVASLLDP